jgi:hypothetical protein
MMYIAHRGNTDGPKPEQENSPGYIDKALSEGFYAETDVRKGNMGEGFIMGHDHGEHKLPIEWFEERRGLLFIHAKDLATYTYFTREKGWNTFWHQSDDYTLTSAGYIWAYPGSALNEKTICVMPENVVYSRVDLARCLGICSDYVLNYRMEYGT